MRKSSLGRRSSTMSINDTSVAARPEMKSMLLQPGYSQSKRRVSSEDRLSAYRNPPHLLQSASKSRSDMSLLENLPPCTPNYFKQQKLALPSGSARPSRTSSIESNRFSSVGSMKCSKKESRPINDKNFQSQALKKVQDFFQKQPTCIQILDNSYNVKPMTLKKFINIVDYLLKFIDERTNITKENYTESVVKFAKILNYGGKIDRSWLIVVNAQHAWCHVIAFLVWLVDFVNLQEKVQNEPNFLYPEPLCEDVNQDLLQANMMYIQPCIFEQFQTYISNKGLNTDLESEFDRADDVLIEQLLEKQELRDEDLKTLVEEENRVKSTVDNPQHQAEEMRMQKQESELLSVKETHTKLNECIGQNKLYLESVTEEIERFTKTNEAMSRRIKEKTVQRDQLNQVADELKHKASDISENNKKRGEFQRVIQYNEKSINELSKSVYQIEIATAKLLNKMEAPLIEYNNMIAVQTKNEPRLKLCIIDNLLPRPGFNEDVAEANKILQSLKSEYKKKNNEVKTFLNDLETENSLLKQTESEIADELQKKTEQNSNITKELDVFMDQKKKDFKELQDSIKEFEEKTKILMETMPVINTEKRDELKNQNEALIEEINYTMALAKSYFKGMKTLREEMFKEVAEKVSDAVKEVKEKLNSKKS